MEVSPLGRSRASIIYKLLYVHSSNPEAAHSQRCGFNLYVALKTATMNDWSGAFKNKKCHQILAPLQESFHQTLRFRNVGKSIFGALALLSSLHMKQNVHVDRIRCVLKWRMPDRTESELKKDWLLFVNYLTFSSQFMLQPLHTQGHIFKEFRRVWLQLSTTVSHCCCEVWRARVVRSEPADAGWARCHSFDWNVLICVQHQSKCYLILTGWLTATSSPQQLLFTTGSLAFAAVVKHSERDELFIVLPPLAHTGLWMKV